MAEDKANLLDQIVNDKQYPIDPVKFLLVAKIALIILVGGAFFALSAQSIAIIAVIVAFVAAIEYGRFVSQGAILRGNQTPFEGALAYWTPQIIFFIPGILAAVEGLISAFAGGSSFAFSFGASETYLSFINQTEPWFVDVVNYDLATHVENWLIIPSGAAIYGFLDRFTELDNSWMIAIAAAPMALIFALLHGITVLAFTLFAFGFMFLLIAGIAWEDSVPGEQVPLGLATLTASIGWHRGFNIGGLNQLFEYYNGLLALSGDFRLIGIGIIGVDLIIFLFLVAGVVGKAGDYL